MKFKDIDTEILLDHLDEGELGIANLIKYIAGQVVCYDTQLRSWYYYENTHWDKIPEEKAYIILDDIYKEMDNAIRHFCNIIKEDENKDTVATAKSKLSFLKKGRIKLQKLSFRKSVLKLAKQGRNSLSLPLNHGWDTTTYLLGTPNGVVDLKTGELGDASHKDWISKTTSVEYDPNANQDAWRHFLKTTLDDEEIIDYLQKAVGYAVTGDNDTDHKFFVLYGSGRNGKGIFCECILEVLGDYGFSVRSEMLLSSSYIRDPAGHTADLMALRGRRFINASEIKKGMAWDNGKIKYLTGGDTIAGRLPYDREEVRFKPTHTMFIQTNDLPACPPDDIGLFDRISIIDFPYRFVDAPRENNEKERVPDIKRKLLENRKGILAWIIEGAKKYHEDGKLVPIGKIIKRTELYRLSNDKIGFFLKERCHQDTGSWTKTSELYTAFKNWAEQSGYKSMTNRAFYKRIQEKGFTKSKRQGTEGFADLMLK